MSRWHKLKYLQLLKTTGDNWWLCNLMSKSSLTISMFLGKGILLLFSTLYKIFYDDPQSQNGFFLVICVYSYGKDQSRNFCWFCFISVKHNQIRSYNTFVLLPLNRGKIQNSGILMLFPCSISEITIHYTHSPRFIVHG